MGDSRTKLKEHPHFRGKGRHFCKSQGWRQHRETQAPGDSQKSGLDAGFPTGKRRQWSPSSPSGRRAGLHTSSEECSRSSREAYPSGAGWSPVSGGHKHLPSPPSRHSSEPAKTEMRNRASPREVSVILDPVENIQASHPTFHRAVTSPFSGRAGPPASAHTFPGPGLTALQVDSSTLRSSSLGSSL